MQFVDELQRTIDVPAPPRRIVSLVPSITETLFAFGIGERVVGVTEYCTHPAEAVAKITKIGGTKNPQREAILALSPDIVIVNDEENRREDFTWLAGQGLTLYVTAPRTVVDGISMIEKLGKVLDCRTASEALAARLRAVYERVVNDSARHPRLRVVCPIWRKPWMAFNADTYADNMLWCSGGENIFRESTERYFSAALEEVAALAPDVVLLPSEPYPFTAKHFAF